MKIIILLIGIFNIIDYFGTNRLLKIGAEEINPIMNLAIRNSYFTIFKLIILPILIFLLWKYQAVVAKRKIYKLAIYLCFSFYTLLMIYYSYLFFQIQTGNYLI